MPKVSILQVSLKIWLAGLMITTFSWTGIAAASNVLQIKQEPGNINHRALKISISDNSNFQQQRRKNQAERSAPKNPSTFEWIRRIFIREKSRSGTHGDFCMIAPNALSYESFSPTPRFVWQGKVTQIEVSDFETNLLVWRHSLTETEKKQQSVIYSGNPLVPSKRYIYQLKDQLKEGETIRKEDVFIVLERDIKLKQLESKLAALRRPSDKDPIEQSLRRIELFNDANLFFDIAGEVFGPLAIESEGQKISQDLRLEFCK